jgi:hypothetical protein
MSMILLAASSASHSGAAAAWNSWGACGQWSSYDATRLVKITAALEEVRWDEATLVVTHEGERKEVLLAPVARMAARGLEQKALKIGKIVTIEAYPSTANANELRAERIAVDGRVIALR